jgi:hypothetical protein
MYGRLRNPWHGASGTDASNSVPELTTAAFKGNWLLSPDN